MTKNLRDLLNYTIEELPREDKEFYISASDQEITEMMNSLGIKKMNSMNQSLATLSLGQ